jgi:bacterioferritin-associated ferredoxin
VYVCICNAYRDNEIVEVAEEGARSAEEAFLRLGNGPCCRQCLPTAQAIIDRHAATGGDSGTRGLTAA